MGEKAGRGTNVTNVQESKEIKSCCHDKHIFWAPFLVAWF